MDTKNNQPSYVLTIAIPHFNEVGLLRTSLKAISDQLTPDVEVLICDNASGQAFDDVIDELRRLVPDIRIHKNAENLGYDQNVDICVEKSRGKFVWLLGSGDCPAPSSIGRVLTVMAENPDVLTILPMVKVFGEVEEERQISGQISIDQTNDDNIELSGLYCSALSGNIILRSAWLAVKGKELTMQNWCHVERLLQAASEFLPAQYVLKSDEVVVIVNRPKNGWWNQDDATLIYNTMAHVEIVRAYLKVGNLSRFEMPRFCNRGSLSVIKAVLHARSVSTVA